MVLLLEHFKLCELCIALVCILSVTSCQQTTDEPVQNYNAELFRTNIIQANHYVLFYIPWHGDTKSILPIWEEMGQKHNKPSSDVRVVKVDCVQEKDLCASQDVSDSPTIKFYKVGGEPTGVRYRGVRDFHSLEQFMNTLTNKISPDYVYGARVASPPPPMNGLNFLQDENFEDAVANGNAFINFCTPWSTKCMDLDPVWKALAKEFQYDDDVTFGMVDCTNHKKTCNDNEVRGYPSILWLVDGVVEEKYPSKDRDIDSLRTYLFKKLGKQEVRKPAVMEDEPFKSAAEVLGKDTFRTALEENSLVFVYFMTPWCTPCQTLDPRWEEMAQFFQDGNVVKVARLDCARNKVICDEENVDEFPTLNLYRDGKLDGPYTGAHTTEELISFCKNAASNSKEEL